MLSKKMFYLFLERGERREKERDRNRTTVVREKHQSVANWGLACNPGMCPDRESNQGPFALWEDAQPTEPHRSGLKTIHFRVPENQVTVPWAKRI